MNESKRKGFFIGVAIFQIIGNVLCWFNVNTLANEYLKTLKEQVETMGPDIGVELDKIFNLGFATNYVIFASGICTMIGIALLLVAMNERIERKKGLAIFLLIMMLLFTVSNLATNASIIGLVAILCMKSKKKEIKTEPIDKLDEIKITNKDKLLSILLVAVYCSQFFIDVFSDKVRIYAVIGYYLVTFALCLYVFRDRYKRDFFFLKNDFSRYIKYIFKMWGVMLLASLGAAILVMLLNGNTQSANQEALTTLPVWFMIPAACIWAPVVEEAIFRGVLRRFISNDVIFVIVSSVTFGLLHTIGQEATLYLTIVQSLQYIAMGAVMAIVYVKSNNITTNMGVHCIQNTISTILISILK